MLRRGRVEFNKDPKQLGRVKVRIPSIHGVNDQMRATYLKYEDLPWVSPCIPGIAGEDFGTFVIPPVGTWVWIMYEDDNPQRPVYIGSVFGKGFTNPQTMMAYDGDGREWQTEPGRNQRPDDVFDGKTDDAPDRGVIFKSPKGHTVMYDDTTGEESFTILDRAGQFMKFSSPVPTNTPRRGLSTAEKDEQLDESPEAYVHMQSGKKVSGKVKTWMKFKDENMHIHTKHDDEKDTWIDIVADEMLLKTQIPDKDSFVNLKPEKAIMKVEEPEKHSFVEMTTDYAEMRTQHPEKTSWIKSTAEDLTIKTEIPDKNSNIHMTPEKLDIKVIHPNVTSWVEMLSDKITLQIIDNSGTKSVIKLVNGKVEMWSEDSAGNKSSIGVTPEGVISDGNGSNMKMDKNDVLINSGEGVIHFNPDKPDNPDNQAK
ncbi:baseplate hub + tail lysozyme [Bacillus phage SP-15]|uniref:Baseplate hub + tail lysozyme n=1 Tax=Bacillus phage SP-15 TaxID=1792032 RepID=A0A127AW40_9CAUD|nr:baseplate hub + tail lysozyme [Bacillus phage SP-15]AMM44850.1 baseplate hub + tail lysozyme [Bacillus phage SP-15]